MANNTNLNTNTVPIPPASGGTGVANTGTITVGGNTSFSGAFTFAGTVTGNTAVTFPTSGTLATTAGASGIVNSGTANQIGYYASTGTTISGITGANGSVLVTDNTGVPSMLANPSATGRMLQSTNAAIPAWSTATYPATTSTSRILYSSSANTVGEITTANSSILVTDSGGIPSLSTTIPFTVPVTTGGTGVATMTTAYAPVLAGTTATGALQVADTGLSTSGWVLTSNGAAAKPSFQVVPTQTQTALISRTTLTPANFNGMSATPVQVIAAQGAHTYIVLYAVMVELVLTGTAFTSGGAIGIQYGNTASLGGKIATATQAAAGINANTASIMFSIVPITMTQTVVATFVNTGLFITNNTGAFTGGTGGTVFVNCLYSVFTTSS